MHSPGCPTAQGPWPPRRVRLGAPSSAFTLEQVGAHGPVSQSSGIHQVQGEDTTFGYVPPLLHSHRSRRVRLGAQALACTWEQPGTRCPAPCIHQDAPLLRAHGTPSVPKLRGPSGAGRGCSTVKVIPRRIPVRRRFPFRRFASEDSLPGTLLRRFPFRRFFPKIRSQAHC